MSRNASYQTQIVVPKPQIPSPQIIRADLNIKERFIEGQLCLKFLRTAMEKAARDHGGRLTTHYLDCNGQAQSCLLALQTPGFPRGIGVDIAADGRVIFVYDTQQEGQSSGQRSEVRQLCDEIAQNYAALAVARALQEAGFAVEDRTQMQGNQRLVTIQGVKVA